MNNTTIVTGLWDISRHNRPFEHYIENFQRFLKIPQNLYIYIPAELEDFVWQHREPHNTRVKILELQDIKDNYYAPFWDKTKEIRQQEEWINRASWLSDSPQCKLEWYNPIVQSKMLMLNDARIINPFESEYFYWLDAGLTNTVPEGHLTSESVLDNLHTLTTSEEFLFLSFPYDANNEIHGFYYPEINNYAGADVKYVCRGGLFGGHSKSIEKANGSYYATLFETLNDGFMGTEESIFSIMSYRDPYTYRRYALDYNGLVVKFTGEMIDGTAKLEDVDMSFIKDNFKTKKEVPAKVTNIVKTNIYMLTFNMPEQLTHTINTMVDTKGLLTHPNLYIFDNSTDENAIKENKAIAEARGFEYSHLGSNTGICGGRQRVAEHFHNSGADYMIFFEDDMTFNTNKQEGEYCRNGFRKYVPDIYETIHKIMYVEEFDFLKLCFTEVYSDNDKQCSWYNVPQHIREKYWPDYNKLPELGLDPNCPKTQFGTIGNIDGLTYATGDIYYSNWPLIVSKDGNKKMFIDTTWAHPQEQTWMSHIFQETKEGKLSPAILLASPIWHDRIKYYNADERVES
tara:strand:- start:5423 stop:7132 length:1710 start_codon:yes stop_codon:yes gene_type:complete